jgi:mRNA-degrading endonuclease RelE of RelBE toxin-antitoxin system
VAVAILDFMDSPLRSDPHRVGKPLRGELVGFHSARIGAYRVVYRIDAAAHELQVVLIDHRADVYRPR